MDIIGENYMFVAGVIGEVFGPEIIENQNNKESISNVEKIKEAIYGKRNN